LRLPGGRPGAHREGPRPRGSLRPARRAAARRGPPVPRSPPRRGVDPRRRPQSGRGRRRPRDVRPPDPRSAVARPQAHGAPARGGTHAMTTRLVIDAHHHLWTADYPWLAERPELAPIRRDYGVADLRANLAAAGVDRTVLVEAGWGHPSETVEFLHLAGAVPEIAGVVGHVDLLGADLPAVLARYQGHPRIRYLVGLRDQIQGRPEADFLARPDVIAALKTIAKTVPTFDLVV